MLKVKMLKDEKLVFEAMAYAKMSYEKILGQLVKGKVKNVADKKTELNKRLIQLNAMRYADISESMLSKLNERIEQLEFLVSKL